ncbi:MAG: DUF58 domain-containing protein [Phycisphaerales bacterium]|nr:DUF58 domain-containing protein [Phycisphaerales bacterium]
MKLERRYHFVVSDLFFLGVTVLLGLGAVNSQNNLLFLLFGLALGAILVSGFLSGSMLLGIQVERDVTGERCVRGRMHIRYRVTNRSRLLPGFCLLIEEIPPEPHAWDGRLAAPVGFINHVGRRETVIADVHAWPRCRGELHFHAVRISTRFPFGLMRKSVTFSAPQTVLIQPQTLPLRRDLLSQLMARGDTGRLSSQNQGRGDEFYGLRDYVPGDSMRLVAWRVSARTDALVVREHAQPATTRFMVYLDVPVVPEGDEAGSAAAEDAIVLAASLLREAVARNCEIGLVVPTWGLAHRPVNAPRYLPAMLDLLGRLDLHAPAVERDPLAALEAAGEGRARSVSILVDAGHPSGVGPRGARRLSASDLDRHLSPAAMPGARRRAEVRG